MAIAASPGWAATPPCEAMPCASAWVAVPAGKRAEIFSLAADYKAFMHVARTELSTVSEVERLARRAGFTPWRSGDPLRHGGRYFSINRARAMTLFVVGKSTKPARLRVAAAHIDSPRLDLKARPLYGAEGFALFQTAPHGNILNYQWTSTPLALTGRISFKDGSSKDIAVGLEADDPVFIVPGLSPHVDIELRDRKNRDVVAAEELDPIVASRDMTGGDVVGQVRSYLERTYGARLDDLVSAELSLTPASPPRDVGFDRALMAMYGQDDRFSAYAALRALFEVRDPSATTVLVLADNEEAANTNNTGASSDAFVDVLAELATPTDAPREVARVFATTKVLSLDVNDAINPIWPSAWEKGNAPRVGFGVNLKVYGKGNNATTEYAAWLRRVLDDAGVSWQTATYKVGAASGGTLGGEFSRRNMDVIDLGAPVLSIHNTYDTSSKVDLWSLYRASFAFFTAKE